MTSDLVRLLREHPAKYGGPTVEGGLWSKILEAADRLEAYEHGVMAIQSDIEALVDRDLELKCANAADAAEIDRLDALMRELRQKMRDRAPERQRIFFQITGLRQALQEIGASLPLSTRDDAEVVHAIQDPLDRLVDTPEEVSLLRDIIETEGPTEAMAEFAETLHEGAAVSVAQEPEPGGAGGQIPASAGGQDEEPLHQKAQASAD